KYNSEEDVERSLINDVIFIKNFDDVPIMIYNYNLSMAKSANQRQLAESKLVSNSIANITDKGADPKDRFMDAMSLVSNLSPASLFGKFVDEHDFYKQQQAEQKDMALNTDTVTGASRSEERRVR